MKGATELSRKRRRRRHVPQRTCVGCRQVLPKRSLVRIVRAPDGVQVDLTGKSPGRGAYLHNVRACWEKALKGSLARALRTELTRSDLELLVASMDSMEEQPS